MEDEYMVDKVVESIIVKLKAMNEVDKGILSDTSVTVADRLAVILGSFKREYHNGILSIDEKNEDIEKVMSTAKKYNVELGAEEVIILGKTRRFITEKAKTHGANLVINKVLDIEAVEKQYGKLKQII